MTDSLIERGVPSPRLPSRERREIPGLNKRFNAGAWITTQGDTMLLLREVDQAALPGEPDRGPLVKMKISKGKEDLLELKLRGDVTVEERVVWHPDGKVALLEDPRVLPVENNRVMIGMTAVLEENGFKNPYPAITYLPRDTISEIKPFSVTVMKDFGPGKNMTPVDPDTFFFRQEESSHQLLVLSWDEAGQRIKETGVLAFPADIDWASWKMGTGSPPIWIDESKREALMLFHGIQKVDGLYVYAIGRALLRRDEHGAFSFTHIDRTALLHPDDFIQEDGAPLAPELHPELRRALYVCGHTVEEDTLSLFVNHGDTTTIPHEYSFAGMIEELRQPEHAYAPTSAV